MELISYKYSIPYLIFLGWLFMLMFWEFNNINKAKDTKTIRRITVVSFLFFFGLRGHIQSDFINYYPYFENLPTLWGKINFQNFSFEPGFELYSIIIKSIWNNYFFWVFVGVLIDICILGKFFKLYSKYYVLSFIVFYVFQGMLIEFNLYRNSKAIMLFLISIKYLQERKIMPYMLLNLLGVSFHFTSLIYLPLYFILTKQLPKGLLWSFFIGGNIIVLFGIEYVEPIFKFVGDKIGGEVQIKITKYFQHQTYSKAYGITLGYLERVFTFVLIMFNYNKLIKQSKYNIIFLNCYLVYFISFFYFNEISVMTERITLLFIFSYWILYSNIFFIFSTIKKHFFLLLILFFGTVKLMKLNNTLGEKYQNILFRYENYKIREKDVSNVRNHVKKNNK